LVHMSQTGSGNRGRLTSWYSLRWTLGTSMLCVEGEISSCTVGNGYQ
jgi:hypothetical protein